MTISSPPDRSINRFVPRAAAQIAGETGPDAVEGRPASERDRRHDHPGGADAALCTAVLHERALQRMDVEARALAVDGGLEFHVSTLATCMSFSGVAGISRISNPACRSALMT